MLAIKRECKVSKDKAVARKMFQRAVGRGFASSVTLWEFKKKIFFKAHFYLRH